MCSDQFFSLPKVTLALWPQKSLFCHRGKISLTFVKNGRPHASQSHWFMLLSIWSPSQWADHDSALIFFSWRQNYSRVDEKRQDKKRGWFFCKVGRGPSHPFNRGQRTALNKRFAFWMNSFAESVPFMAFDLCTRKVANIALQGARPRSLLALWQGKIGRLPISMRQRTADQRWWKVNWIIWEKRRFAFKNENLEMVLHWAAEKET